MWHTYSVMQSDENSFCWDVVLESVNVSSNYEGMKCIVFNSWVQYFIYEHMTDYAGPRDYVENL